MPLRKELFEYVKLEEPDTIKSDLSAISIDFEKAMAEAKKELELQQEKHAAIDEARKISRSILDDLKILNKDLLRKTFEKIIGKRKTAPLKKEEVEEVLKEAEFAISGEEAIRRLQKNLEDLKRELGVK